ncbi:MAG: IS1595 family transposase [Bryobacterales bacterium]|nr:IS1595 family transposase [Bryobacterales bacterium]
MNLIDVAKQFATEEACLDYLENMRWPDGVTCLKCGGNRISKIVAKGRERVSKKTGEIERSPTRYLYECLNPECGHQFTATTGTIFHDTHLPLEKWFLAVALMVNAKKGLSALQLKRDLNVAYKTAWYLSHRIRKAMGLVEAADDEPLKGTVEADETYIGGKYDKRRKRTKYDKPAVFGVVERDGRARTCYMPAVSLKGVVEKIKDSVSINATAIHTNDSNLYGTTAGCLKNHNHQTVRHIEKEWVRGDVHTGTIDGYWGLFVEARRDRLLPSDQREAPEPLPFGVPVQVEPPQGAGHICPGDLCASDRVGPALRRTDQGAGRRDGECARDRSGAVLAPSEESPLHFVF